MLKVALVGCGKIADSHAAQIGRIPGCELVGVCDREQLMAKQLFERYPVKAWFSDLDVLLEQARPDVVHITTPPQSHFSLASHCLERGCHVYVEKPFTLYYEEAEQLIELAQRKGLLVTAGHDDQFRHGAREMRRLIKAGFLGGPPVHMESYYCYELGGSAYATALLADKQHWVRRLPGGLFQNIISHGIARIAEFLSTEDPKVIAHAFVSRSLHEAGESEILDELRVIIHEHQGPTAYFTFSSQMRPSLHQFRVYGQRNGLVFDQDQETLIKLAGSRRKSYLEQFVTPAVQGAQYFRNSVMNVRRFLKRDFHSKAGMKFLIEAFYASITSAQELPISYREILLTAKIMDSVFTQIRPIRVPVAEPVGA